MIATAATWAARAAGSLFPDVVGRLPVSSKTIFLTFDDGPSGDTSELLDLLHEFNARATFFLQGDRIEHRAAAAQRIISEGHGVGNHSFHHLDGWQNRWVEVREDLIRGTESIVSLTGSPPRWMRPPYGRFHGRTRAWCRDLGQRLALWDVMAGDFIPGATPDEVAAQVMGLVRPGSLLVLHDGDVHQPRALSITKQVLRTLSDSGWSFDLLPDSGPDRIT